MMRALASAVAILALAGAAFAAPARAPAAEDLNAQDFMAHCKKDWEFCRVRILAQMTRLNASREACIPGNDLQERGAARVAYVLEEVLEEDASAFESGDYSIFTGQIIVFIWPCDVVS